MDEYKPIACGDYDGIELMAMRRSAVEVRFRDSGLENKRLRGRVVDTAIHDGGEFLVLETDGVRVEIRLDLILQIVEENTGERWRRKTDG